MPPPFFTQGACLSLKKIFLEAGKIVNTHGIAGEVKVIPWCDGPEFLLDFDRFYIDGQPISVRSARVHKHSVLLMLEGIANINDAMRLKDKIIFIHREDVTLPEGKHFLADLVGLEVREAESGKVLGRIAEILTPPAHEVYVVRGGEREYMIPAVDAFVLETCVDDGYIVVRLIEGM
jgi:16S rRNA processing protein RimM